MFYRPVVFNLILALSLFNLPLPPMRSFDTVTGTLIGRVLEQTGAPMPGVLIRVTNLETGNVRASRTNAQGEYRFVFLPLGRYSMQVIKEGFIVSQPAKEPIKVQLNRTIEVMPDIILAPAVVAVAPPPPPPPAPPGGESPGLLVNRIDPSRRFNFDSAQLRALPLPGSRTFDDLAFLAPGVAPAPEVRGAAGPGIGAGIGTAGQFSVNGLRARSNNFTVDGASNNDEDVGVRRQGFVVLTSQSVESVGELQIITQLWDAEQGRNFGSQINAVSRAGSNAWHGSIYGFFSDDALNARDFFDYTAKPGAETQLFATVVESYENGEPINPVRVPVIRYTNPTDPEDRKPVFLPNLSGGENRFGRQQLGGNLSFPVAKDRTFAFGSFERLRTRADQEMHFAVPTVSERGFLNSGGSGFCFNPCTEFTSLNPTFIAGDAVFSLFPFPNNPAGPYGENTLTRVLPANGDGTIISLRVDHQFQSVTGVANHQLTGRYNFAADERQIPAVGGAISSGIEPDVRAQNLSIFHNSQLGSRLSNQFRTSFGRTRLRFNELRDPQLAASKDLPQNPLLLNAALLVNTSNPLTDRATYQLLDLQRDSAEEHLGTVGQVAISPYSPVGLDVTLFPQGRVNNTYQFADTVAWTRGRHAFRFGADLQRTQLNSFLDRDYRAKVHFGGTPDLSGLSVFDPIFTPGSVLFRDLSQSGPTPGYFRGADLAALALPTAITQSLRTDSPPDASIGLRFWQLNFFATDQWRVSPGLSLSFGLRYEYNTVPRDAQRRIEDSFNFAVSPPADPNTRICFVFSSPCSQLFPASELNASFASTLAELQRFLGGRESIYDPDRNNFSPHFGFSWDPWRGTAQAGKMVVRGGASINYDLLIGNLVSQSRNVYPNFLPLNIDSNTFASVRDFFFGGQTGPIGLFNPLFFGVNVRQNGQSQIYGLISEGTLNRLGTPGDLFTEISGLLFSPRPVTQSGLVFTSGGGLAFTLPDRELRTPYAIHYNLQFEREFGNTWLINLAYVGTRGAKLTRFRTPNGGPNSNTLPLDPFGFTELFGRPLVPTATAIAPGSRISERIFSRPNPRLGAYTVFDSSAGSSYHAFQSSIDKRFSRGFQFTAAYTWSHAIDEVSDLFDLAGAFALPQDDRNLDAERGSANFDLRHRFSASLVAELPFLRWLGGRGSTNHRLLDGWQLSVITTHQTGQPFTVNSSLDVNLDGNLTDRLDRIAGIGGGRERRELLRLLPGTKTLDLLPAVGESGRIGRNTFRADAFHQTDLALLKNIRLRGEQSITLRVEVFNLWNRAQFAIPVRILEAPSFGSSVETRSSARQIQFALKYLF